MSALKLSVNGREIAAEIEPQTLLVELLRGPLGLTGTHIGCDTSQCGCCNVLLDGVTVKACSMLAMQAQGRQVTTVEGLADATTGVLHPLQQAFIDCHGLQCGFCTPGMLISAAGLLKHNPEPSDDEIVEALEGNLCRCTGYANIVAAVRQAAQVIAVGAPQ